MNNALVGMYQRQVAIKPKLVDNELIAISSEDSQDEAAYNSVKKSNGAAASTSQSRSVLPQGYLNNRANVTKQRRLNALEM